MNPKKYLDEFYTNSFQKVGSDKHIKSELPSAACIELNTILEKSQSSKAVLTVLLTSIVYKILNPEQDIRKHQSSIEGGYSGRTFDTKYITPFLKNAKSPSMAESGWLTRSLEQKAPYTLEYKGAIRPQKLKTAFLNILDKIEKGQDPILFLDYLIQGLIIQRNKFAIDLAKPVDIHIVTIAKILKTHFKSKYVAEGASRLPTLALHAIYQCIVTENQRFEGCSLMPLENHTTSDIRSGHIGDIEIRDKDGRPYEAVEIKHGIPISAQLVKDAFKKFSTTQVKRYYLLSTANINKQEEQEILSEIERIKNIHGCQVIANGIIHTLKYYLRLLSNPANFIENYVNLLEKDKSLKFEHKVKWNEIIASM